MLQYVFNYNKNVQIKLDEIKSKWDFKGHLGFKMSTMEGNKD